MNLFSGALLVARLDLKRYFRDKGGVALGFALPVVLVAVMGFSMKLVVGTDGGLSKTTLWVVDQDQTDASRAFVKSLGESSVLRISPEPGDKDQPTEQELEQKVRDGEAHHALVILKGYSESVAAKHFPALRMYRDPGRDMEKQLVGIGLMQAVMASNPESSAAMFSGRAMQLAGLPDDMANQIVSMAEAMSKTVHSMLKTVEDRDEKTAASAPASHEAGDSKSKDDVANVMTRLVPVANVDIAPPDRPKSMTYMLAQSVSGIGVMMLMFGLMACSSSLIRERQGGTLPRLLLSSIPRNSILLGKLIFCGVIGAMQMVVMFTFGGFVFHVEFLRDPVTLVVLSLSLLLAVTGFGVLIAAWASTEKQAEGMSTLLILVMAALGGAWFPIQMLTLPTFAKIVTHSTLTWWAMNGMQGMLWYGKSWTDPSMLIDIGILLGFAAVALTAAFALFRRRYADVR